MDDSGDVQGLVYLALDSQDRPHISYLANQVSYAHKDGAWSTGPVGFGTYSTSVAVDSGDAPHLTYSYGRTVKLATLDGSWWMRAS